jgi:hypothetical protein
MKILVIDCYGTIFEDKYFTHVEEPGVTEPDKFRLKYENSRRTIENQQSSYDYLKNIQSQFNPSDYDSLYLVGSNGSVLTASYIIRENFGSYSNPEKYINALDKFNFIKDCLYTGNEIITLFTDQYYSIIYKKLSDKFNIPLNIIEVSRFPSSEEIPNTEAQLIKFNLK